MSRRTFAGESPQGSQPVRPVLTRSASCTNVSANPRVPLSKACRAAIVTGGGDLLPYPVHGDGPDDLGEDDAQLVDLCVLNPTGLFFREGVPQDERPRPERGGGTWHWPERV